MKTYVHPVYKAIITINMVVGGLVLVGGIYPTMIFGISLAWTALIVTTFVVVPALNAVGLDWCDVRQTARKVLKNPEDEYPEEE